MKNTIYLKKTIELMSNLEDMVNRCGLNKKTVEVEKSKSGCSTHTITTYEIDSIFSHNNDKKMPTIEFLETYFKNSDNVYITISLDLKGDRIYRNELRFILDTFSGKVSFYKHTRGKSKKGLFAKYSPTEAFDYIKHVLDYISL